MDYMKNMDCNQIKIFIDLEIIGEEKFYIFFKSKNLKKKNCNLVKPLSTTTAFKPNFYFIYIYIYIKSIYMHKYQEKYI